MFEAERPADPVWKDAEALVERVEQQAGLPNSPEIFFENTVAGFRLTSKAAAVEIRVVEGDQETVLGRSGVALLDATDTDPEDAEQHHRATAQWLNPAGTDDGVRADRLIAQQRLDDEIVLTLDARFDRELGLNQRRPMGEIAEVVLELSAPVFLRLRVGQLRRRVGRQTRRDSLVSQMHGGLTAQENYASIVTSIASATQLDRVSLLRAGGQNYRLVSTSTVTAVDRRARQVRLLQRLVTHVLRGSDRYCYRLGAKQTPASEISNELEDYLRESGSRELCIESVKQQDSALAAIVLERFRVPEGAPEIETVLDTVRGPAESAIRQAVDREKLSWRLPASPLSGNNRHKTALRLSVAGIAAIISMTLIWAPLKIPAEGNVVATNTRHIYSPTIGIVDRVFVSNGQHVTAGEPLVSMRSRDLELQERKLRGTLATAQTRLDSILASRSPTRGNGSQDRVQASADEEILKTEINGLEQQLKLLEDQRNELVITSPIQGVVDQWDLQQSLVAKPVVHGQHLLDVISPEGGWSVELEIADQHINYLLQQQSSEPCLVSFRLRSDPAIAHQGVVAEIAETTHLNAKNQCVVRVVVPFDSEHEARPLRSGATVLAKVNCGKRRLGFVWFRGFFEWWRRHAWL